MLQKLIWAGAVLVSAYAVSMVSGCSSPRPVYNLSPSAKAQCRKVLDVQCENYYRSGE